jgi:hypothetical protein
MSKKIKLAGALLGAIISTSTMAYAHGENGKCGAGKCGGDMKKNEMQKEMKSSKCAAGSCSS